jgi:uncharacterized membrane protein YhaH (DUF805 family)
MTSPILTREQVIGERGSRTRQLMYWCATLIVAVAFAVPGVLNLIHAPHVAGDMAHLGYPRYFSTILGTWKLLAAVAVLAPGTPRIKEWAYAGMVFDLTGAAASRLIVGDSPVTIAIPLMITCVVAVSWRLRPASRRLAAVSAGSTPFSSAASFGSSGGFSRAARGGTHA